ncbi:hypothetical protein OCEANICA350_12330 [Oceanicaulis sp. 350]|nr:hypothetical protein OCEANICA350_12330 [Oceanicaulis sp. 350]
MGERLHGMQEVVGSIPSGSTKKEPLRPARGFFFVAIAAQTHALNVLTRKPMSFSKITMHEALDGHGNRSDTGYDADGVCTHDRRV